MVDISREIKLEPGSHAHRFLALVGASSSANGQALAALFGVKPSEISRQAKRLKALGLVDGTRHGRFVFWSLTDKGRRVLKETSERQREANSLLLRVEYRLAPQTLGAWALVREIQREGSTSLHKLKIGDRDDCLVAFKGLREQAEALSAAEDAQAAGIAADVDRLYP